jgi:D-lactate dehydrogenase
VNIDTGSFIKSIRSHQHSLFSEFIANFSAKNFAFVQSLIRGGLTLGNILGSRTMKIVTHRLRKLGMKSLPLWNPLLPAPSPKFSSHSSGVGEKYIYFPSCLHRTMGVSASNDSVINLLMELAPQIGVQFIIPKNINSLCCGMPFASKGFDKAHHLITDITIDELYLLSEQGQIPILLDMSPCSYHISSMKFKKIDKIHFIDIIQFFHDKIDVLAEYKNQSNEILIHHTCSGQKLQQENMFEEVINSLADNVIKPQINGCCGSAGDRGLFFPELTKSAAENCVNNYPEFSQSAVGVSSSKMCELSMSQVAHVPFYSIVEFVHQSLCSNNDN